MEGRTARGGPSRRGSAGARGGSVPGGGGVLSGPLGRSPSTCRAAPAGGWGGVPRPRGGCPCAPSPPPARPPPPPPLAPCNLAGPPPRGQGHPPPGPGGGRRGSCGPYKKIPPPGGGIDLGGRDPALFAFACNIQHFGFVWRVRAQASRRHRGGAGHAPAADLVAPPRGGRFSPASLELLMGDEWAGRRGPPREIDGRAAGAAGDRRRGPPPRPAHRGF